MASLRRIMAIAGCAVLELYRRRDVYVAVILAAVILVPLSGVNLFGVGGVVRYLHEVALLLIWLFSIVITLTTAGRQLPGEIERRTILPLLSKPVRRSEVVLGKFVGAVIASGTAVAAFYLCYVVLTGLKSGQWFSWILVEAFVLHLAFVVLATALCICGSTFLTAAANLTCCALITGGMLLYGHRLVDMAQSLTGFGHWLVMGLHLGLPHFEFFDLRMRLIHEWEPLSVWLLLAVVGYAVVYAAVLLAVASLRFKRQRV